MNEVIETRSKHHGKSNYRLNKCTFSAANTFKAKLQICLAYSCTTYQQMFDGLSGSSLNTMKMATLILTFCCQQYQFVILSKQLLFLDGYTGISYQQCTPMIHKSSLPSHSAKQQTLHATDLEVIYLVIYISRLNGQLNMRSRKKDEHFKATEGTLNVSLTVKRFYRSTNDQHVLS
ncbi:hypothetical protein BgiBS90_011789 [Biomphalaria glabrata]|nr:hypothetical protein BgiBS90_011789 [Biomphalaria glabrata]